MQRTHSNGAVHAERDLFSGSGEMCTLLRAYDWTASPLGPVRQWPHHLRTVLRLCLMSHFPAVVLWGPDFLMFYNDAFSRLLVEKRPDALGQPIRKAWPGIWTVIGPMLESVLTTGKATGVEDLPFFPNQTGVAYVRCFTLSFNPIQDEDGTISGVLCPVTETTERIAAEQRVRESEDSLQTALTAAQMGTWDLDLVHDRAQCSRRHDEIFGYSTPRPVWSEAIVLQHVLPEDQETVREAFRRAREKGELRLEVRVHWPDGSIHWISALGRTDYDALGTPVRMAGIVMDITARKQAEEELRQLHSELEHRVVERTLALQRSEEHFRIVAQVTNDLLYDWEMATDAVWRSNGFQRLFGAEQNGDFRWWACRVHPNDRAGVLARFQAAALSNMETFQHEYRFQRPNGDYAVVADTMYLVRDERGTVVRAIGAITDISALKEAEAAQRALSRQLLEVQERERRRIALELHDELGQSLQALKVNLLSKPLSPEGEGEHTQKGLQLVEHAIEEVRTLATNLRPSILDDLGLSDALEWYVQRQASRLEVVAYVTIDRPDSRLTPLIETTCFRVVQEAMTNIARHARARHVWVELWQDDITIHLSVRDDGIGFDVTGARRRAVGGMSLGLLGMEERVRLAGGEIEIASLFHRGTQIDLSFPRQLATAGQELHSLAQRVRMGGQAVV